MKTRLTAFLLAFLFFAPAAARADDDAAVRAALESRYAVMKTAFESRDAAAINALYTSDFTSTDVSGQSKNAAEVAQAVNTMPPDTGRVSRTTLGAIAVSGDGATVTQNYDMRTTRAGKDGSPVALHLVTSSTDTWQKVNDVWLLQKTRTDSADYYVNDKLVSHMGRTAAP